MDEKRALDLLSYVTGKEFGFNFSRFKLEAHISKDWKDYSIV